MGSRTLGDGAQEDRERRIDATRQFLEESTGVAHIGIELSWHEGCQIGAWTRDRRDSMAQAVVQATQGVAPPGQTVLTRGRVLGGPYYTLVLFQDTRRALAYFTDSEDDAARLCDLLREQIGHNK